MAAMVGRWVSSWQGTDPGLVTHDLRIEATESVGLFFRCWHGGISGGKMGSTFQRER